MDPLMERIVLSLDEKVEVSAALIREACGEAKRPAIGFSGGKKSVALLSQFRSACALPLKVFLVRTPAEFESRTRFAEKLKKLWRLDLIVASVPDEEASADPQTCCRPQIARALARLAEAHAIDLLMLGNSFEDPRPVELPEGSCLSCVNPILHFGDGDIRDYMEKHRLPHCSLYDEGYTKLDCRRCTAEPQTRDPRAAVTEEERLIREKMKRLGYL